MIIDAVKISIQNNALLLRYHNISKQFSPPILEFNNILDIGIIFKANIIFLHGKHITWWLAFELRIVFTWYIADEFIL